MGIDSGTAGALGDGHHGEVRKLGWGLRVVRPPVAVQTLQRLPYFLGVSAETTDSIGLALNFVVVPPGAVALPHVHIGCESAIYQIEGRVLTRYGEQLEHSVETGPGDFLYIPAGVPHQTLNLSATERAAGVVARNEAAMEESVELYDVPRGQADGETESMSP
jgi:uncharacterized RmlC-like cupin family protein